MQDRGLSKSFQVDIYGKCGNLTCKQQKDGNCFEMLENDYKFYLAFENSNCKDYITEKFFSNSLHHNVLPIVMGPSPEDYAAVAPPHSFLHVDQFKSPAKLAKYLKMLDEDNAKYNEFFEWQTKGEWVNTGFFCRLCSLLNFYKKHGPSKEPEGGWAAWWQGEGVCHNSHS